MDSLSFSVVINTYNRYKSLKKTLESLELQNYKNFEVIVVNGPSTDQTLEVCKQYLGRIKVANCPVRNLSVSRNIGIDHSSGDIVAFIDDDAYASSSWLSDLAEGYTSSQIGGVGGKVYDHTGMKLQCHYNCMLRNSNGIVQPAQPPLEKYCSPNADPFLYLIGTNSSFRREALEKVQGFDEEYEYFLDETDLCMRIIDAGFPLNVVDNGVVHHKYLESHIRNHKNVIKDPYPAAKNIIYFTLHNLKKEGKTLTDSQLWGRISCMPEGGKWCYEHGLLTEEEFNFFNTRLEQAVQDGRQHAEAGRSLRPIQKCNPDAFLPFPTRLPSGNKLTLCFASSEYPPHYGGIGRYTYDLATTFAAQGHEVHVITSSHMETDYVDFEELVWVHRLVERPEPALHQVAYARALHLASRNYKEAMRIHEESPISVFIGPLWGGEGALVNCSRLFPVIMSLMTTHQCILSVDKDFAPLNCMQQAINYEKALVHAQRYIHAISHAIKQQVSEDYGLPSGAFVSPLCVRDVYRTVLRTRKVNAKKVRLLFVGRIEPRKGIDILLKAAEIALERCADLEFHIIGKDIQRMDYHPIEDFFKRNRDKEDITSRVKYFGEVEESELSQHYINCDILCMPSRFESFGLVLLEGMVFEKPCIAARVGGMQEIVQEGSTGLLFESENVSDLAEKIITLAQDQNMRKCMGQAGRNRFETVFSPKAVTKDFEKHVRSVIRDFESENYSKIQGEELVNAFTQVLVSAGLDHKSAYSISELLISSSVPTDISSNAPSGISESHAFPHTQTSFWKTLRLFNVICSKCSPNLAEKMKQRTHPLCLKISEKMALPRAERKRWIKSFLKRKMLSILPSSKINIHLINIKLDNIDKRQNNIEEKINLILHNQKCITNLLKKIDNYSSE